MRHIVGTYERHHQYPLVSTVNSREDLQYPEVTLFELKVNEVYLMGTVYPRFEYFPHIIIKGFLNMSACFRG